MLYIFESDGAGNGAVAEIFHCALGEEKFVRFYCPPPTPPALPYSRSKEVKDHFGKAGGIASNICIAPKWICDDFPDFFSVLVVRNPISAAISSYQQFLLTYAPQYWSSPVDAPSEYRTIEQYIRHVRGENYLVRALGAVSDDEQVNEAHFARAMEVLGSFNHIVLAEDFRLTLGGAVAQDPNASMIYGSSPDEVLAAMEARLAYDVGHVAHYDFAKLIDMHSYDLRFYEKMVSRAFSILAGHA